MTPQRVCFGWKRDRSEVHLESRTGEPVRSAKITSGSMRSYGDLKTMHGNAMPAPTSFLFLQEDFHQRWSFLGPGSEKKWYSIHIDRPQGECDRVAELMMIKFSESGHPVFQATSPLSRGTL